MKKVISFSLWGDNPKYTIGAIKNAELAPFIYTGWEVWFYVANSVPHDIVSELETKSKVIVPVINYAASASIFFAFSIASSIPPTM